MKAAKLFLVVVVMLAFSVCLSCSLPAASTENELQMRSRRFREEVENACTEYRVVSLADLAPVTWDRALLFQGYITAEEMYDRVGYRWREVIAYPHSTQLYRIVFLEDGIVVYEVEGYANMHVTETEVFYKDNPSFIVRSKVGEPRETANSFRDDSIYLYRLPVGKASDHLMQCPQSVREMLDAKGMQASDALVGKWISKDAMSIFAPRGELIVSKEGLLCGFITYGPRFVQFWSIWDGDAFIPISVHKSPFRSINAMDYDLLAIERQGETLHLQIDPGLVTQGSISEYVFTKIENEGWQELVILPNPFLHFPFFIFH